MPFTGFDLKYPEYEVITPQTHLTFNVRTLNVQEEERLKGSLVTPIKVTEHLNKCIWEAITKKPETIKDFESFLKLVTLKDREALLYGLYHITYEEIRNYDIRCGSCKKEYAVTINASDTFNFNGYPGTDNILSKRIPVPLVASKGVNAVIKQPSLFDEIAALRSQGSTPGRTIEIITETLIIDKFEQDVVQAVQPKVYDDRGDIIDAYLSLPARDKRVIYDKYMEEFGNYGISLKMRSYCTHCSAEDTVNIDMVESFFRMVYSS